MSSWPCGKAAYIPPGLFALFSSEGFKGVTLVVTPQEPACLILVLSYLLPSHTGFLPSLLMIRTHLWLRGAWVGLRNFCLRSAFCHIRGIKHVCSKHLKAGVFLPFLSLYLLCLPLTVSSPLYLSACLFTLLCSNSGCTSQFLCFPFLSCV